MAEVAGGARGARRPARVASIAAGIDEADLRRDELVPLGLERARRYTWERAVAAAARTRTTGRSRERPLVVVDADVLGRRRTGDETYVLNLLRELGGACAGGRPAARGRRRGTPSSSPPASSRRAADPSRSCGWPDAAAPAPPARRRARPLPARAARSRCPVRPSSRSTTSRSSASRADEPQGPARLQGGRAAGRNARPARVLTVSERTRRDLRELYAIPDDKIVVTPNGVDPVFTPGDGIGGQDYVLVVGAVQERKNPLGGARGGRVGGAAADRRRPGEGRGARARARAPWRADRGLRGRRRARRAVPRRRLPRPAVPLRGLRAARARGDGVRDAGRRRRPSRRCRRSPATPRSGPRSTSSETDPPRGRRPRPARRGGARARAPCSRGARPRGARSRSTGRRSAVTVSAIVVSHGPRRTSWSARCRRSLRRSTTWS